MASTKDLIFAKYHRYYTIAMIILYLKNYIHILTIAMLLTQSLDTILYMQCTLLTFNVYYSHAVLKYYQQYGSIEGAGPLDSDFG